MLKCITTLHLPHVDCCPGSCDTEQPWGPARQTEKLTLSMGYVTGFSWVGNLGSKDTGRKEPAGSLGPLPQAPPSLPQPR